MVRKFQRLPFPAINPYTAECSYFADCILRGKPPVINGAAGAIRNMTLIEKAYQSARLAHGRRRYEALNHQP